MLFFYYFIIFQEISPQNSLHISHHLCSGHLSLLETCGNPIALFDGTLLHVSQGIQQDELPNLDGEVEEPAMQKTSYNVNLEKMPGSGPEDNVSPQQHVMNEVTDHWPTYTYLSPTETKFICFQYYLLQEVQELCHVLTIMRKIFGCLPINGHSNNKIKAESIFHLRKRSKSCKLCWPILSLLSVGRLTGAQKSHVPNLYCIQMFISLMYQFIFTK
jgi:hypothetical protein